MTWLTGTEYQYQIITDMSYSQSDPFVHSWRITGFVHHACHYFGAPPGLVGFVFINL